MTELVQTHCQQPHPPACVAPALPVPLAALVVLDAPHAAALRIVAVVAGGAVAVVLALACEQHVLHMRACEG
jgi:hypothetical protein